ncbi:MAG: mechanosensitive ion channel [Lachnospiraceae bacterium]|nr:mechanosensitive ion channel [Lachnospiraceae bacterium]
MGEWLSFLSQDVINVCRAILLLFAAYIVAGISKMLFIGLLKKTKLSDWIKKTEGEEGGDKKAEQTMNYIGKLVYLLVFLLFVPGIFSYLGISQVADPILRLLSSVWGYVPNIIAAVIVILVGNLVAKLVRQLVAPLLVRAGLDRLQEKAGLETKEDGKLSVTVSYILYVLILIPVIVVALQALGIETLTSPAIAMLSNIFSFIPNIAVAVMIMLLGGLLGKLLRNILRQLLASSGVDMKLQKLLGEKGRGFVFSTVVSELARVIVIIFFVVEGLNVLHLSVMTKVGATLIDYMPNVLAALVILLAAVIGADLAENALKKSGLSGFALITRVTIVTVGIFMILSQLGIADQIVTKAFLLIVAALAVAFGVAFGVGGREFAKHQLDRLEKKLESGREEAKEDAKEQD